MLVKTVVDDKSGRKWEIYKTPENTYYYDYFEFFANTGWKFMWSLWKDESKYTKESIEFDLDIELD